MCTISKNDSRGLLKMEAKCPPLIWALSHMEVSGGGPIGRMMSACHVRVSDISYHNFQFPFKYVRFSNSLCNMRNNRKWFNTMVQLNNIICIYIYIGLIHSSWRRCTITSVAE